MTFLLVDCNYLCAVTSLIMLQDILETESSQSIEVIDALGTKTKTCTLNLNFAGSMYLLAIMSHKNHSSGC